MIEVEILPDTQQYTKVQDKESQEQQNIFNGEKYSGRRGLFF